MFPGSWDQWDIFNYNFLKVTDVFFKNINKTWGSPSRQLLCIDMTLDVVRFLLVSGRSCNS